MKNLIKNIILLIISILIVYIFLFVNKTFDKIYTKNDNLLMQNSSIINNYDILKKHVRLNSLTDFNEHINVLVKLKYSNEYEELAPYRSKWDYDFQTEYLFINFNVKDYNLTVYYNEINKYLIKYFEENPNYKNESRFDIDLSKKHVAFTFDDGPNDKFTLKLLKILDENSARATFFMQGIYMKNLPHIVKAIYLFGNESGNHSYSHPYLTKLNVSQAKEQLNKTSKIYKKITDDEMYLVRPPYGSMNNKLAKELDYPFILWNIDTNDWRLENSSDYIVKHVLKNIKDGDIILFHDSYEKTLNAVERILPELNKRGFQVVTVSQLAKIKKTPILNGELYFSFK
jgi:peptidoglycan/xylan/chitin deacetylase (PgdA/CDA1 family)